MDSRARYTGRRFGVLLAVSLVLFILVRPGQASVFPEYDEIAPTVAFWESVYAKYTLHEAIIHDKDHPYIVYEVVRLRPERSVADRRNNRRTIARVKKKYRRILLRLARRGKPTGQEEKRVHDLFGPMASKRRFRDAADNVRFQLGQKDRFARGVKRSGAWLSRIKQIFRRQGVPEDLVYLAHVESSFDPRAYSKFGAAGIWQFTRSTGRRYMRVGYVVDERRDPLVSSRAAARLLADNYRLLKSWPLAVTAYNHGLSGMMRAVRKKGDYCSIYREYCGPGFGFASRNFYSEFLAARKVAKNYHRFFPGLIMDRPEKTFVFTLPAYAAVSDLTDLFGVGIDRLRRLNPALREPVLAGRKYVPRGYRLNLPDEAGRMTRIAANISADILHSRQKPSAWHRVRRGETVSRIARLYGVKVGALIKVNGLDRRGTIYAGQRLRLPGAVAEKVALIADKAKFAPPVRVASVSIKPPAPLAVAQVPHPGIPGEPGGGIVVASSADGSSPEDLTRILLAQAHLPNKLADYPSEWRLPRSERFYQAALSRGPAASPERLNSIKVADDLSRVNTFERGGRRFGLIRVAAAETLGHYAEWLGVSTRYLRRVNHLRYGQPIHVNQRLRIPLPSSAEGPFIEQRIEYHRALLENFFAAWRIKELRPYRIKSGDSIWTLCARKFDLPFWLIARFNQDLDPQKMRPSQEIMVPVVVKKEQRYAGLDGGGRAGI